MADWPFVGRADEQSRIRGLLRRGPPVRIVLTGGVGIGKTRLAARAREEAAEQGFAVAHAIAGPATAGIPFGALASLLPVPQADDPLQVTLKKAVESLVAGAGDGPVLLSVDDAQHLDERSLGLLQLLAAAPEVAVLLTVRTGRDAVLNLDHDDAERVDLEPLTSEEVHHVLVRALGGPVTPGTVEALVHHSGGNPLYLKELVLGSRRSGQLTDGDGLWQLTAPVASERLTDLVSDHLAALDADARRALELVVIAGSLGYAALADLVGDLAVEALEEQGLVTIATDGRRRNVSVAHPVHAEIARATMTTRRSMARHREVADALEAAGARRRDDVLRIAVSRLEAGGEVSPPLVTEAARRALAADDLLLGERLARLAYEAGGGFAAGLDLAGVLTRSGRQQEAAEVFRTIDAAGAGDRGRALHAIEWAECLFWGLHEPEQARAVLDEAWDAVADEEWRDQIVVTAAAYPLLEGRPAESLQSVDRILEAGSPRGVAASALIAAPALAMLGRGEEALAAAERGLAARTGVADSAGLVNVGMLVMARVIALTELGRPADAIELGAQGHVVAVEAAIDYAQAWFAMVTARAHLLVGDLEEADRWFREGAAHFHDLALPGNRRWCLFGSAWALALQGQLDRAERQVATAEALPTGNLLLMEPETRRAEAALALAGGHRATAVNHLVAAADLAEERGLASQAVGALHDLVRLGLVDHVDRLVQAAKGVDGVLAAARARHGTALRAEDGDGVGAASDDFAAAGARLLAAEAAAQASALHRAQGHGRTATKWAVRSRTLLEAGGAPGSPTLLLAGGTAALTDREREVATLATSGLRNQEIASRLGLSRRTVDNHLHRAYTKLGVDGREALAAALEASAE